MSSTEKLSWFEDRDVTAILVGAGCFSTVICVFACVVLTLSEDFLNEQVTPLIGWINPSPTPRACPAVPAGWVEVFNDEFDSNSNGWPVGKEDDAYAKTDFSVSDGVLRFDMKAYQGVYSYQYPRANDYLKDFYIRTNVRRASGAFSSEYGITFRLSDWNHYYFAISDSTEVLFYRHIDDDENSWQEIYQGYSELVRPGEYNELAVLAQGYEFTVCINQQLLIKAVDSGYKNGQFGIGVSLNEPQDEAVFEYEDYTVFAPQD
jgi:hypothetical protein